MPFRMQQNICEHCGHYQPEGGVLCKATVATMHPPDHEVAIGLLRAALWQDVIDAAPESCAGAPAHACN